MCLMMSSACICAAAPRREPLGSCEATTDGDVTSLELFDGYGNTLVIFFGKRKPGSSETEAWRKLISDLE